VKKGGEWDWAVCHLANCAAHTLQTARETECQFRMFGMQLL